MPFVVESVGQLLADTQRLAQEAARALRRNQPNEVAFAGSHWE